MRTRTRAYTGGDTKKAVGKPAASNASVSKLQSKLKSKSAVLKKEVKSMKLDQKLVLKAKNVTRMVKADINDKKVFSKSFVNLSPLKKSSSKASKTTASVKKEADKKPSPKEKSSSKKPSPKEKLSLSQGRRSRSLSRKADPHSPSSLSTASKKTSMKSTKTPATGSSKSASEKSKIVSKGGVKRRSESIESTIKRPRSADAAKFNSKLPRKVLRSPGDVSDQKPAGKLSMSSAGRVAVSKSSRDVSRSREKVTKSPRMSSSDRRKSPAREAKASSKSVDTKADDLSMLIRPSLLTEAKKKRISLIDASTSGQKRKRVTNTYETELSDIHFKEPASKRITVSQTTHVISSTASSSDSTKSKPTAAIKSVVETPLTSLSRPKITDESSMSYSYAVKPLTSASERGDAEPSDGAGLLSPERRGVWEIEGRKSTLLEKLWSWSPTNAFKFRKSVGEAGKYDEKEMTSGFSYREDHFDKDVAAAQSTRVQSMEELHPTSDRSPGLSTRSRNVSVKTATSKITKEQMSVKGAASKLLKVDLKTGSKRALSDPASSISGSPVKSKRLVNRKCITCTMATIFACAVMGVLAMYSLSYLYTETQG